MPYVAYPMQGCDHKSSILPLIVNNIADFVSVPHRSGAEIASGAKGFALRAPKGPSSRSVALAYYLPALSSSPGLGCSIPGNRARQ